jgi:hypothetical protein
MAYIPQSNSVVAFQSDPTKLVATVSVVGTIGSSIIGKPPVIIPDAVTINPASVSGTVGASIIGLPPVNVVGTPSISGTVNVGNLPTTQNVSGSVVAFQGTNPWIVTGSVQGSFSPSGNQSVSGTIGSSAIGTVPVVQSGTVTTSISGIPQASVHGFVYADIISSVAVNITPAVNQSVSGTVGASVVGLTPVAVTNTPSISGTVLVGNTLTVNPTSVSGTIGASIIGLPPVNITGGISSVALAGANTVSVVGTVFVAGSIAAITPPVTNQSVSGTVGASAIGLTPVAVTNTPSISGTVNIGNTNINVSGSVAAFQGGAWTQSVVGTIFVAGSVATVGTAAANQSVSGTVGSSIIGLPPVRLSDGTETLDFYEENQIDASVIGIAMMFKSNTSSSIMSVPSPITPLPIVGSVSGSIGVVGNPSISGTVLVGGITNIAGSVAATVTNTNINVSGSVAAFPQGTIVTSIVNTVPSSVIVGASIFGLAPVNVTNTNLNVAGSVVAFQGTSPWIVTGSVQGSFSPAANQSVSGTVGASVIGTVPVIQSGTWTASLVSTVPSSVIVGASIFGLAPVNVTNTNLNIAGSVVSYQGTNPWIMTGSVQGSFSPAGNQSVSGTVGASVIGTVPVVESGTWTTSLVSTIPSSVIVGASIFGLAPVNVTNTNLNISGSVVAFQGSGWSGSVVAIVTNIPSISGTVQIGSVIGGPIPVTGLSFSISSITQSGTWNVSVVGTMAGTGTLSSVKSSISTVTILSANTNRKGATVYNNSGTTVYLNLGTSAQTSVYTVAMNPNDYYEVPFGYTGIVAGITASNAGLISTNELT